ncbi:MAG: hypothetical protein IPJ84_04450 [Bdellovibrionales bacterium]|nr:hypothetical protein [Bdellovibrionales bacterium]
MLIPNRPVLGLYATLTLAFAVLGCQPKPETSAWRLKQPILRWEDERGIAKSANVSSTGTANKSLSAVLQFSPEDRGLSVKVSTNCRSGAETLNENTHAETAADLSLARILPVAIFSPDRADRDWICQIELTAHHPDGNTHTFTLRDFQFRTPLAHHSAQTIGGFSSLDSEGQKTLTLACPKWTAQESDASSSPISRERVQTLSTKNTVLGDDTRASERRPTCALLADETTHRKLLSHITLQFQPPRIEVSPPTSLLPATEETMYFSRKPVLKWSVTVKDDQQTTLVFPKQTVRSRLISPGKFQTSAIKLPYHLDFDGATSIRRTEKGDFVAVDGRKTITVTMTLDRQLLCFYTPFSDYWEITSQLRLEAEYPLQVETVAGSSDELLDERTPVELMKAVLFLPPERPGMNVRVHANLAPAAEPKTDDTRCSRGDFVTLNPADTIHSEE